MIERLRRVEEPVLDTLLVSSLSPELGPDDVAAALRLDADGAQRSVDRARASGLIEPSHSQAFCGRSILVSLRSSALQDITISRSLYWPLRSS